MPRATRARSGGTDAAAPAPTRADAPDAHWARALREDVRRDGGRDGAAFARGDADAESDAKRCAVRAMRALFDRLTSAAANARAVGEALPLDGEEFVVEGCDAEQVWTQLDAQCAPVLRACKREVKALGRLGTNGEVDVSALFDVVIDGDRSGSGSEEEEEDGDDDDDDSDASEEEDEEEDEDALDDSDHDDARAKSGKKSSGSDRTGKFFKNPGMFSLDDMENFLDDAEEEEGRRRGTGGGSGEDEDDEDGAENSDDDESDEENDIYRDMSESDDDDEEEDDDDLDDALAYTAKLAGVSTSARAKKMKKTKGKKAQDLMFDDFFGKHKGKPLGGTKGGKLGAANEMELNELSDEEEDMFNQLEGDEKDDDEDTDEEQDDAEDDVQGEIETGIAGNRGIERHDDDDDEYAEDEEEEEDDEELAFGGEDDEELDELDRKLEADLDAELARAQEEEGMSESDDDDSDGGDIKRDGPKSAFQIQQEKLARQIEKLEASAIGDKTWVLKGEASAKQRPLNSALETDLEFEHVMAPAPVISEEITQKLEDLIKQRIIEGRFDDVERVEPVEERERREAPQLDDTKSAKGLGDIYADEYMKQKVGVALGEKEDPLVAEAKKLWALLSYRLDQLSQVHKVEEPRDIEERITRQLEIRAAGDEVPLAFNEEQRQAPEEIFTGGDGKGGVRGSAAGAIKADEELTKEERKAGRAKRKRKSKAVREEKDRVKSKRDREREAQNKAAEDAGFTRKAPKVSMLAAAPAGGRSKSEFSKSSKVFGMLQDAKDADAARGGPAAKKSKSDGTTNRSSLKL